MKVHKRTSRLRWSGLAVTLGLVCGLAAPTTKEVQAADAPATSASIAFERYKLDNGLEVILHRDPSTPQVAINVWYHVVISLKHSIKARIRKNKEFFVIMTFTVTLSFILLL
ncbi:MAG: hypothetical protein ACPG4T_05445, partial [Nannocystaceae bacterium]